MVPPTTKITMRNPGFGDFDFLIGEWTISNEVLKRRLVGSSEWEFPGDLEGREGDADPDGGFGGNLDQMFVPARGFTGMTLRLYDPQTELWSIYWSDTKSHRLFPPTIGRFEDGRGEFFGDDVEGGGPVRCASTGPRARARAGNSRCQPMAARLGEELGDAVRARVRNAA